MIRNYTNKKIYRNLKIVRVLAVISIPLSILGLLAHFLSLKYNGFQSADRDVGYSILFCVFTLLIPIRTLYYAIAQGKKPPLPQLQRRLPQLPESTVTPESTVNNDFANTVGAIICSFVPLLLAVVLWLFFWWNSAVVGFWFGLAGGAAALHFPLYIADGFLIHNCVLIKREWKENLPEFIKIRQAEKEKAAAQKETDAKQTQFRLLIDQCGIKFFIKYYKEIKRMPLRDVEVSENFTPAEREERLSAAKRIIDAGLSEFAFREILHTYADILNESEIRQVKSMLSEWQPDKSKNPAA